MIFNRSSMMCALRIALAILVISSIACVLVTPDPTDDVDGILRSNNLAQAHRLVAASLLAPPILLLLLLRIFTDASSETRLITSELLGLTCVYRC